MKHKFFRWQAPLLTAAGALLLGCLFSCGTPPSDIVRTDPVSSVIAAESEETSFVFRLTETTSPEVETTAPEAETTAPEAETTVETKPPETTAPPETEPPAETAPLLQTRTEETLESVPFGTQLLYTDELYEDETVLLQAGVAGVLRVLTTVTTENGREVSRAVREELLSEPTDEIRQRGTRPLWREETVTEVAAVLPYPTEYIENQLAYDDETELLSAGADGQILETYTLTYYKDRLQKKTLLSSVTVEPTAESVSIGTMPSITEKTEVRRESVLSYPTVYENDPTLAEGSFLCKTAGLVGYTDNTYRLIYYHGSLLSCERIASDAHAPQAEVILVGTLVEEETFRMPFVDAAHGGIDYRMTQDYGGSNSHGGIDFGVYYGAPIVAAMSGTVVYAYNTGDLPTSDLRWTYGTYVVIEHENGTRTYYAHLKSRTVSVGDEVSQGDVVGYSGNTGRVSPVPTAASPLAGTHLHFEIRVWNGSAYVKTDPKPYLPYWQ